MSIEVSFIIPCFNEAEYIGNCINAIYSQNINHNSFELIVVDNGSTDSTREIASALGAIVLVNTKRGAASSRNMGARDARGNLLAFIDADCLLDPMWLSQMMKHLSDDAVVASAARAVPNKEGLTWVEKGWAKLFVRKSNRLNNDVTAVNSLGSSNLLINKKLFEKAGGFDEVLLSCEDYDLSQRIQRYGILLIDEHIRVTHLRESKTLLELFRREVSRGRYSLRCYAKNGFTLRELPSIAIPFFTIFLLGAFFIFIVMSEFAISSLILTTLAVVPTPYMLRSGLEYNKINIFFMEYAIAATYVAARSFALLTELSDLIRLE